MGFKSLLTSGGKGFGFHLSKRKNFFLKKGHLLKVAITDNSMQLAFLKVSAVLWVLKISNNHNSAFFRMSLRVNSRDVNF